MKGQVEWERESRRAGWSLLMVVDLWSSQSSFFVEHFFIREERLFSRFFLTLFSFYLWTTNLRTLKILKQICFFEHMLVRSWTFFPSDVSKRSWTFLYYIFMFYFHLWVIFHRYFFWLEKETRYIDFFNRSDLFISLSCPWIFLNLILSIFAYLGC